MTFAQQVRSARKRLGLTQTELADHLGVSFATVNRWEAGSNQPQRAQRDAFFERIKVPPKPKEKSRMNKFTSVAVTCDPKTGHMIIVASDEAGYVHWGMPDEFDGWRTMPPHPGLDEGPSMFDREDDKSPSARKKP